MSELDGSGGSDRSNKSKKPTTARVGKVWQTAVRMPKAWHLRLLIVQKKLSPYARLKMAEVIRTILKEGIYQLEKQVGLPPTALEDEPTLVDEDDDDDSGQSAKGLPAPAPVPPSPRERPEPAMPGPGVARKAPPEPALLMTAEPALKRGLRLDEPAAAPPVSAELAPAPPEGGGARKGPGERRRPIKRGSPRSK